MKTPKFHCGRHRFPPQVIEDAAWLYHRFWLSFGDIEDLLAESSVPVPYETLRQRCTKSGPGNARRLHRRYGSCGDARHVDEDFIPIDGGHHYLCRAVDQDGAVIDMLSKDRRKTEAAVRFFHKLEKGRNGKPRRPVTDKLRRYSAAGPVTVPDVDHVTV